ncbi:CHAT domain-containing protein [Roseibium aggregatum]|uniref:CHAT domain-containing protein n=1 Tax=Roseibium aggregatum TaxID=187304 RepID=A0A926P3R6_9HYPH|nr:CHAT domain-containing protein [Roseibium aggregatum]MBD1548683.1 CHAT domain-containing protein [Roseibium aggregatum]
MEWTAIPIERSNVTGLVASLRNSIDFSSAPFIKEHRSDVSKACNPKASIPGPEDHDFNLCEANDLYRVLLQPFEDKLKGVNHLIVVPDGALEQLPFSLLTRTAGTGGEPHWLIEDMAITMLPTTSSLRLLRSIPPRDTAGQKPYLGIAPVDFQRQSKQAPLRGTLAPLPGTLAEVRRLSEITGAGTDGYVTGKKASEAFVKSGALEHYRVLSFATHGLLSADTQALTNGVLTEPALALAPANDNEDGFLTATEAASLKLNADWVLLSACNTAAGDGEGAEGLSGLARAFFFAGARSLLVSHWEIDDNAAVDLMAETIRRTSDGSAKDKAEALREAMLTVMKKPGYRHPYFWAPFSLVGDNRISGRTPPPDAGKGGS